MGKMKKAGTGPLDKTGLAGQYAAGVFPEVIHARYLQGSRPCRIHAEIRVQAVPVLDLLSVVVYAPSRSLDDESKEEK